MMKQHAAAHRCHVHTTRRSLGGHPECLVSPYLEIRRCCGFKCSSGGCRFKLSLVSYLSADCQHASPVDLTAHHRKLTATLNVECDQATSTFQFTLIDPETTSSPHPFIANHTHPPRYQIGRPRSRVSNQNCTFQGPDISADFPADAQHSRLTRRAFRGFSIRTRAGTDMIGCL